MTNSGSEGIPEFWKPVFRWLEEDPNIAASLTAENKDYFASMNMQTLTLWKEAVSYQGFDIKRIIKLKILSMQSYLDRTEEITYRESFTINGEVIELVYTKK